MKKTILKFHIGRGGRFYNAGHLTYVGEEKIGEGNTLDDLFFNEDDKTYYSSSGGLHDDLTSEDIESGIGVVNIDFDFDTTYTCYSDDLSIKEKIAIARRNPYNCAELLKLDTHTYNILISFGELLNYVMYEYDSLDWLNILEVPEDVEINYDCVNKVDGKYYAVYENQL